MRLLWKQAGKLAVARQETGLCQMAVKNVKRPLLRRRVLARSSEEKAPWEEKAREEQAPKAREERNERLAPPFQSAPRRGPSAEG